MRTRGAHSDVYVRGRARMRANAHDRIASQYETPPTVPATRTTRQRPQTEAALLRAAEELPDIQEVC